MLAVFVDSTPLQFVFDALIVLLVVLNALIGWQYGIVRRGIALAAVYAGVGAAAYIGNSMARFFHGSNDLAADAWAFVAVFAIVVAGIEMLGALYHEQLKRVVSLMFDRVSGVIGGLFVGFLEAAVFVLVAATVMTAKSTGAEIGSTQVARDVSTTTIGGAMAGLDPGVSAILGPVLPKNFGDHLSNNGNIAK